MCEEIRTSASHPGWPASSEPTRPWCVRVLEFDRCNRDFRTCLAIKKLQRKIGVDTLVSSLEQIARLFPLLIRGSTACQSQVFFVIFSVYLEFALFVLPKSRPQRLFSIRLSVKRLFSGRTVPSAYSSARRCALRRSAVRAGPLRTACRMSEF